jgi:hypothetical protein
MNRSRQNLLWSCLFGCMAASAASRTLDSVRPTSWPSRSFLREISRQRSLTASSYVRIVAVA